MHRASIFTKATVSQHIYEIQATIFSQYLWDWIFHSIKIHYYIKFQEIERECTQIVCTPIPT